jgi:hypothetical protein
MSLAAVVWIVFRTRDDSAGCVVSVWCLETKSKPYLWDSYERQVAEIMPSALLSPPLMCSLRHQLYKVIW